MSRYDNPQVSVIMSVFNGEKYILRSLMSILAQTYRNFEIILIDDGSTDRTAEIVEKIHDARLRFCKQENLGLTKTLNNALKLAKGTWIARHDADDFSISTRFEQQLAFLNDNPSIGLLGSSCFIQPEKHGLVNEVYDYPENHDDIMRAFVEYNPFVHGAMMIRRDLLEECGGYNENYRYVQDYELWSRLLSKTKSHNLTVPLYVRSVHGETSQVIINKEPIFNEIRDNYLDKAETDVANSERHLPVKPIRSISLYPVITSQNGWNRSISTSLYRMSKELQKHNFAWLAMRLQSFLYCPWYLLVSTPNA